MTMTRDSVTAWERHGQTITAGLILAAIIWVGKEITDLTGTMGVVLNRIQNIESTIAAMDERFDKYQTKREAEAAKENQMLRDQMIHSRLDALESEYRGKSR
jgi:hypothetical protein